MIDNLSKLGKTSTKVSIKFLWITQCTIVKTQWFPSTIRHIPEYPFSPLLFSTVLKVPGSRIKGKNINKGNRG